MKTKKMMIFMLLLICASLTANAQHWDQLSTDQPTPSDTSRKIRSSPAFAELILRRAELEATGEELLVLYEVDARQVKENRFELVMIDRDLKTISSTCEAQTDKLTLSLGKLLVRRATLAKEHWVLKSRYGDAHRNAQIALRKLKIFDRAIDEIM